MSNLIERYNDAKSKLAQFKKLENQIRLEVIDQYFPKAIEGTHNQELTGYEIKATFKMNHKFDAKALEKIVEDLSEEEFACINYKPSLKLAEYKKLSDSERELLDETIITTPALPSIKITAIEE